jgi:hypothetical protein
VLVEYTCKITACIWAALTIIVLFYHFWVGYAVSKSEKDTIDASDVIVNL